MNEKLVPLYTAIVSSGISLKQAKDVFFAAKRRSLYELLAEQLMKFKHHPYSEFFKVLEVFEVDLHELDVDVIDIADLKRVWQFVRIVTYATSSDWDNSELIEDFLQALKPEEKSWKQIVWSLYPKLKETGHDTLMSLFFRMVEKECESFESRFLTGDDTDEANEAEEENSKSNGESC